MTGTQGGAFFVHCFHYLLTAYEARNRAAALIAAEPFALPPDALVAIIFSALGAEAFINEVGEMAGRDVHSGVSGVELFDQLDDLAATLAEIEGSKGPVELKYQITSKILSGRTFNKGVQPFQDFADLMRLRNDLVHLRHRDKTDAGGYVSPSSIVVQKLQQKGLTYTRGRNADEPSGGMSWLNEIETVGSATWAYQAARNIVFTIGEMLPDDYRAPGIRAMKGQISNLPIDK